MTAEIAPHRTRDHGQHDVIDGTTESALHCLHRGQVHRRPVEAAVRSDLDVERGGRCRPEARADARCQSRDCAREGVRSPDGRQEGACGAADEADSASQPVPELGEHEVAARRYRSRHERPGRRAEAGIVAGLDAHRGGRHLDAADAVHHAVMHLRDHREAVAREPLDEPRLPQRLSPVELLGHEPANEALQLTLVARARQARMPQMVVGIEGRIVHPHRVAEERNRLDALAVPWHAVENHRHELADAVEVEGAAGARGWPGLEHAHRPDVHVGAAILDAEEGRVEGGEPFVMCVGHHRSPL